VTTSSDPAAAVSARATAAARLRRITAVIVVGAGLGTAAAFGTFARSGSASNERPTAPDRSPTTGRGGAVSPPTTTTTAPQVEPAAPVASSGPS
jgi:hypothetical protein